MKNLIAIFCLLCLLSSCSKDDNPLVDVKMTILDSSKWKSVSVTMSNINMRTTRGVNSLQNFDQITAEAATGESVSFGQYEHFDVADEMTEVAPYFITISATDNNDVVQDVFIERSTGETIKVPDSGMIIVNNAVYNFDFIIDPDKAFVASDDGFKLSYEGLGFEVSETLK